VSYLVRADARVEKYLTGLRNASLKKRLLGALRGLEVVPRPSGCVKLSGSADLYRLRVGAYRIINQIRDSVLTVLVVEIGHRRDVYR
jgi:mRNA interferase RelE/StbE